LPKLEKIGEKFALFRQFIGARSNGIGELVEHQAKPRSRRASPAEASFSFGLPFLQTKVTR
jgi:hypothetical protein